MPNSPIQDVDHETLSALFDGQLVGDQARFALKRLGHDAQWRRTCGHWQLVGDVLRGHAGALAPTDFAERVMAAVAHESLDAMPAASTHAIASRAGVTARRRWIGGAALAASVAMAALFVVRPLSQTASPMLETPAQQIAAGASGAVDSQATVEAGGVIPAPTLQIASVPQAPIPQAPVPQPASPSDAGNLAAAAAIAVAEVPRRAGERRSRGQSQRAARRGVTRAVPDQVLAAGASASLANDTVAVTDADGSSVHPFQPRGEITSRPWPRAALSDYPVAGGALTASYGGGEVVDPTSPSFYPFEPHALQADAAAPRSDWPQPND